MTDSTDNALKPCPFCGDAMESFAGMVPEAFAKGNGTFGICCDCGCIGPFMYSMDGAVTAWNRRADLAPDPQDDPRVKALRGCASMVFLHMSSRDGVCTIPLWVADDLRAALAAFDNTGGKTDG